MEASVSDRVDEKKVQRLTGYVILRSIEIADVGEAWFEVDRQNALSAAYAIKQSVGENEGSYKAVPASSFKTFNVKVETKVSLS